MEILVAATLLARVVLAATFVTSGTAKLFDPAIALKPAVPHRLA